MLSLDYRLPGKLNNPSGDYCARLVFYCEKIRVFKADFFSLNRLAWNNKIGFHSRFFGLFMKARLIGTVGGIHIQ